MAEIPSENDPSKPKEALRSMLRRQASGRNFDNSFEVSPPKPNDKLDEQLGTSKSCKAQPVQVRTQPKPFKEILEEAGKRAIGGGLPGALAMVVQVGSLMWLHTTLNYQYRYGTGTFESIKILYAEGGIRRFYRGVAPALLIGPLSRFGDTAANAGMFSILNSYSSTQSLPLAVKTACGSFAAGGFRIFLMPIDTLKTVSQVEGLKAPSVLKKKIKAGGIGVMWHGAFGAAIGTMVSHYPWFFTFYYLDSSIPKPPKEELGRQLGRNALIGFCSSFISDCTSNSLHVIKTTKQTYPAPISYPETLKVVLQKGGIKSLMFRGLKTRIVTNGFQGMLFTLLWKYMEEHLFNSDAEKE